MIAPPLRPLPGHQSRRWVAYGKCKAVDIGGVYMILANSRMAAAAPVITTQRAASYHVLPAELLE
jgi:hypothetical protein